ncbi:CubicO group peptidase, beta-lactamase class C family [Muriicola jejuensis]|uniref:Serine hydrolase n=1 Tax=Muriicola jejuensis TaxID=504488 RepID=A0A6P0UGK5_9FLAO|nr:serine hydrolase domain-containing protein [Muriicola jejuensis]NER11762.1 serine hydrolase [Muriicola jejuensis]SMP26299.1 CubicO group peptidase, beta-lactamase class C family [Muriicola jejuensis]
MRYILILIFLSVNIQAQDISKLVNDYTNSYVKTGDFSGCILITKNENILFEGCFGFANQSFQVPNEINTKFKIGSVSKQFTAAAILILEQQGLLKTTDTLSKFFPNHANAERITIHQLLTHTSGITDIYNVPDFNKLSIQKKIISDLTKLVLDSELQFEPGTQYQYSNGGYAILAEVIEKVSGSAYQDYLNEHILQPLKMTATGHNRYNDVIPNLAIGYDPSEYSNVKITDFLDPELLKGSGSLYSTVQDLQLWIESIKNRSLMNKESFEKLLKNYGNNYGYGISLYKSFEEPVFGHDGRVNGYIADYLHYIESDITVIILGNIQTGVADFFRTDIAAIIFKKEYKSRAKRIPPADDAKIDKQKIIGTYAFGPNFKVYVEEIEGSIQARANEGGYSELILLEDKRFFSRTLYSYIEFKEDDQGKTNKMVWTNNDGNSFEGLKE